MTRDLRSLLHSPSRVLGTWTQIAAPELIDLMAINGLSFTVIDCQHSPIGIETAEKLARAADANDIAVALRVSRNDPVEIMKALDAGIRHIVVPNVETGEEVSQAVAATRFSPHGLRGACPCCRSGGHFVRNWQDYASKEEERTGIIPLVETTLGHANIDDICAVEGLAGVMIGPFDLSVSMGHHGDWRHRDVREAVTDMVKSVHAANLPVLMPVFSPDPAECRALAEHWQALGVSCFLVGSDKIIIAEAFASWSNALGPK